MASLDSRLTSEEYDRLYGHESGWEFQSGRAYRKPMPTFLHGILASLLRDLLRLAGYIAAVEVDVRLTETWTPRPDVCAVLEIVKGKYPRSVEVVCEVLSENEDIFAKCEAYSATGKVGQMFVFDIETKTIRVWNGSDLVPTADLLLRNGVMIAGRRIWRELEAQGKSTPPSSMILD